MNWPFIGTCAVLAIWMLGCWARQLYLGLNRKPRDFFDDE